MTSNELKQIRQDAGETQAVFALRLGVHQSQISKWERDIHPIPAWVELVLSTENIKSFTIGITKLSMYGVVPKSVVG